jgi:hypothetical protein
VRTFTLVRSADPSGISGVGVVAEGVQYTDGSVALRWLGDHPATAVWPSLAEVLAVHGHEGATVPLFHDGDSPLDRVFRALQGGAHLASFHRDIYYRPEVHALGPDNWLEWVAAVGGSPDAATCEERDSKSYPWEWSWTAPDSSVRVFYITADPDEITLENG